MKEKALLHNGLLAAFVGQDGSGKTTVTNDIREWWIAKTGQSADLVYLGSGVNYSSWRKKLQEKLPKSSAFSLLRAWLQFSKYNALSRSVLRRIRKSRKAKMNGVLVIYDRYPQTQFPGICDGPKIRSSLLGKLPGWLSRIFSFYARREERNLEKAFSYAPDIVFKLVISPEESVRRKPENKLESMKRKHEVIKALKFDNSEVIVIDAQLPYEEELDQIKQAIWQFAHR